MHSNRQWEAHSGSALRLLLLVLISLPAFWQVGRLCSGQAGIGGQDAKGSVHAILMPHRCACNLHQTD